MLTISCYGNRAVDTSCPAPDIDGRQSVDSESLKICGSNSTSEHSITRFEQRWARQHAGYVFLISGKAHERRPHDELRCSSNGLRYLGIPNIGATFEAVDQTSYADPNNYVGQKQKRRRCLRGLQDRYHRNRIATRGWQRGRQGRKGCGISALLFPCPLSFSFSTQHSDNRKPGMSIGPLRLSCLQA